MNISTDYFFDSSALQIYTELVSDYLPEFLKGFEYTPWVWSLIGSAIIGLSGIFPLLIIPSVQTNNNVTKDKKKGDVKELIVETEDLHEIPHEVGDFAILLKSGFNRWDAAKAQLLTATAGLLGALVAIGGSGVTSAMEARTSWIMPFTAGGFLHISLITVLPDLLKEENPKESVKQFFALISGISVMAVMTILFEH
uniref:Uncharacterized protein n=1 Tax=Megaselia scalaris TaxID=36166 RepID=T1GWB6_MEGSC